MRTRATLIVVTVAAALVIVAVLTMPSVLAQSSSPATAAANLTFDAVSVKRNVSGDSRAQIGRQLGGRWAMTNVTAAGLIATAYPSKVDELVGAPSWVTSDPYDIDARATFDPTNEQIETMLRAVLADRFKLIAHYEPREQPIYDLAIARQDRRLGPELHLIDVDCATYKPDSAARGAQPPTAVPPCSYRMNAGATLSMASGGRSMASLADLLTRLVGRPVVDKTGLNGYYAFTLKSVGDSNDGDVSLFTALQEQLGLKLESTKGPVDVLVIDHVEPPTPD